VLESTTLATTAGSRLTTIKQKNIMLKTIHEATEVSLNAYNEISSREIPSEAKDRFKFLGQCLNALTEQLQQENDRLSRTTQHGS
jgi:hypothetical protein